MDITKFQRLAFQLLTARLESYGNRLNEEHKQAVRDITEWITNTIAGRIRGRWAFDLSTGGGKTQAIVAVVAAAHQLGMLESGEVSLVVCQYTVEALCELKRNLIAVGIPEHLVGLQHTYDHDPEVSKAILSGDIEGVKPNHASEPRTENNDSRPVLLCTHNLVRSKADVERYNLFQGDPRKVLIWDEAMAKTDTFSLSVQDIGKAHGWLSGGAALSSSTALKEAAELSQKLMQRIMDGLLEAQALNGQPVMVELPDMDAATIAKLKRPYSQADSPASAEAMIALLENSKQPLRIFPGNEIEQSVISYQLAVAAELNNVVVLNASHSIDRTQLDDNQLSRPKTFKGAVVRYDGVKVYVIKHGGGWSSAIRPEFKKRKRSKLLDEYIDILQQIPEDEGVIIFTYIDKDKVSCRDILTKRMVEAGIDPRATIEVDSSRGRVSKPRIAWMTLGNETSISKYSYCKNELWCGVLYKPTPVLASQICGAAESMQVKLDKGVLDELRESQIATGLHQGFARGACRIIDHGRAKTTKIWLTFSHPDLRPLEKVKEVMPGLQVIPWKGRYVGKVTKVERLAEACVEILSQRLQDNPEGGDSNRISTVALKKLALAKAGIDKVGNSQWQEARNITVDRLSWSWTYTGRAFAPI